MRDEFPRQKTLDILLNDQKYVSFILLCARVGLYACHLYTLYSNAKTSKLFFAVIYWPESQNEGKMLELSASNPQSFWRKRETLEKPITDDLIFGWFDLFVMRREHPIFLLSLCVLSFGLLSQAQWHFHCSHPWLLLLRIYELD